MLSTVYRTLSRRAFLMQSQVSCTRQASSEPAAPRLVLPRLPVPDLSQTLRNYLHSLEPLLLEDEARGGLNFKTAYDSRLKLVEEFERGLGQLCQQRLLGTLQGLVFFTTS